MQIQKIGIIPALLSLQIACSTHPMRSMTATEKMPPKVDPIPVVKSGKRADRSPASFETNTMPSTEATTQVAVLTHNYNSYRMGWNNQEAVLNPTTVHSGHFGLLQSVGPLDGPSYAQPLVVPGVVIPGDPNAGTHDVVYVATSNNSIYAINPDNGSILLHENYGPAEYYSRGILSTPVIDSATNTIYFISAIKVVEAPNLRFLLHAVDITTLKDKIAPRPIEPAHMLSDKSTGYFQPQYQRQRPALLLYNGNIYAGFGSYYDNSSARGWVMGWNAATLTPLVHYDQTQSAFLSDSEATTPNYEGQPGGFLSSIWMSGGGIAADYSGIYFATGNSNPGEMAFHPPTNYPESVIRMSHNFLTVLDSFTPYNYHQFDIDDSDLSAGGVVLLPPLSNGALTMAIVGKSGDMYLLDRNNLGGFNNNPNGPDNVLAHANLGFCWCTTTFFSHAQIPYLVTSTGVPDQSQSAVNIFQVSNSPSYTLNNVATSGPIPFSQNTGFFSTISTSSQHPLQNPIIWSVTRPPRPKVMPLLLAYEFVPGQPTLNKLYESPTELWTIGGETNSNIVPVVANGHVYVLGAKHLQVYGLK